MDNNKSNIFVALEEDGSALALDLSDIGSDMDSDSESSLDLGSIADDISLILQSGVDEDESIELDLTNIDTVDDSNRLRRIWENNRIYASYGVSNRAVKMRSGVLKDAVSKFADVVSSVVTEELGIEFLEERKSKIQRSLKMLKAYLDENTKSSYQDDVAKDIRKLCTEIGFPIELIELCSTQLTKELSTLISGCTSSLLEMQLKYESSLQILFPEARELMQTGAKLHDLKQLKIALSNGAQKVTCPICGKECQDYTVLKFSKTFTELRISKPSIFFEHRPYMCTCGEVSCLSVETTKRLNLEMINYYNTRLMDHDTGGTEKLFPPIDVLKRFPEIIVEDDVTSIEYITPMEVRYSNYQSIYRATSTIVRQQKLKQLFGIDNLSNVDTREELLLYNSKGLLEMGSGVNMVDVICGTLINLPIYKDFKRLHKQYTESLKSTLLVSKLKKSLNVLSSKVVTNENAEITNIIRYLNSNLRQVTMKNALVELTLDNYKALVPGYEKQIDMIYFATEEQCKTLKASIQNSFRFMKTFHLELLLPATRCKSLETESVYRLCEDAKEMSDLLKYSYRGVALNTWSDFILKRYMSKISRLGGSKFESYRDVSELSNTLSKLPVIQHSNNSINVGPLLTLDCDSIRLCLNEVDKSNPRFRFIYQVLNMVRKYSGDNEYVMKLCNNILLEIPTVFKTKFDMFDDIDGFEQYFILVNLGFEEPEAFKLVTSNRAFIDCRSIAIKDNGITLEDYLNRYDTLPRYNPDFAMITSEIELNILYQLRVAEGWMYWNRRNSTKHLKLLEHLFDYVIGEFTSGVDLFDHCKYVRTTKVDRGFTTLDGDLKLGNKLLDYMLNELESTSLILTQVDSPAEEFGPTLLNKIIFEEQDWNNSAKWYINLALIDKMESDGNRDAMNDELVMNLIPEKYQNSFQTFYSILASWKYESEVNKQTYKVNRDAVYDRYYADFKHLMLSIADEINYSSLSKLKAILKGEMGVEV